MSWFTDFAGKAEQFLNKVDQGAASALHSDKHSKGYKYNLKPAAKTYDEPRIVQGKSTTLKSVKGDESSPDKYIPISVSKKPELKGQVKVQLKPKLKNREDDEKLLEFLNNPNGNVNTVASKQKKMKDNLKETEKNVAEGDRMDSSKVNDDHESKQPVIVQDTVTESVVVSSNIPDSVGCDLTNPIETKNIDAEQKETVLELPNTKDSSMELENKFLKNEITSLNQEIGSILKRAKEAETETKDLRNKISVQNSQIFSSEKRIKDLQGKESDFNEALKAKDSQIAVLRVRIEESDQELQSKQKIYDMLKTQNDRLLKEHSDSSGLQNQALDTLKVKLSDAENALKLEKESLKCATKDASDRLNKLEEERRNMASSLNSLEKQLTDEKAKSSELNQNYHSMKMSLDQTVMELREYKQKAQRILQTKEKLIAALKDEKCVPGDSTVDTTVSVIELEELRRDRDSLRDELNQSAMRLKTLQSELIDIENTSQNEIDMMQKQLDSNEGQLIQYQQLQKDLDQESSQLKQEMAYLREDLTKNKTTLQSRIRDRDLEIEKLRKQVTTRNISNTTEAELERRVHALTESLIHKQTILEAMSTEKNSLILQLERLENERKESRSYLKQNHSIVGINEADEVKARVPVFLRESPFDGNITRKVKRAYNSIDIFSVRVGVFLRKYPIVRVFILIYMLLLHFWVFIVLMTYTPETHGSDYNPRPPSPK